MISFIKLFENNQSYCTPEQIQKTPYGCGLQEPGVSPSLFDPIDIATGVGGITKGVVSGAANGIGRTILSKGTPSIGSRVAGASAGAVTGLGKAATEEGVENTINDIGVNISK